MQKQVNFFEQNVEWFALGLGGLFLAWMIFSNVLSPPVKVNVAGEERGPGEVDPLTLRGPVATLKRDIDKREIPSIPQRDYVQSFIAAIQGSNEQLASLSGTQIDSRPEVPVQDVPGQGPTGTDLRLAVKILPKPPAARPGTFVTGRSTVNYPKPDWEPDPKRPQIQQPMIQADKDWASLSFRIGGDALVRSFKAAFDEKKLEEAGVPDPLALFQTAIVDVELVRQQILPGGGFGKEETVKPLLNSIRPPFPGKNAGEFEIFNYLNFISTNPNDLTYPVFYEVLSGDFWTPPTEETERFAKADREARIAQRKAMNEQQRQAAIQRRNQQQAARGARVRPGVNTEEDFMADEIEPPMGVVRPPGFRGGIVPVPPRPVRPGANGVRQPVAQLQAGRFDAGVEGLPDIDIIAHDDTIEAGKTYRYKMRYRLLNPVFKAVRIAPPELTKEFAIVSPWTAWSQPVTMRSKVEFFLAHLGGDKADFDVFEWINGKMVKSTIAASAGDAIGKTGWSVVDVRGSGRKGYLLLVDDTGIVHRREPEDPSNPSLRYLDLQDMVAANNPQVGMNR